jgi:hypothetical protein
MDDVGPSIIHAWYVIGRLFSMARQRHDGPAPVLPTSPVVETSDGPQL